MGGEGREVAMSAQFWPCPGCSRHVKRGEVVCPFCGATASAERSPTRVLADRLSRAALFAAGTMGAAVATTDCSAQPPYGAGPHPGAVEIFPNGTEDASASDASSEVAADAGDASLPTDSASTSDDSASAADVPILLQQAYGAAILPDD
jgi:hypothetical protein